MKIKAFTLVFFTLLIFSCEKTEYKYTGIITGADMAMCACCGGYFIEIDGIKYRFEKNELPGDFTFDDKQIPLKVELNWELKNNSCKDFNRIIILNIRKL